MATSNPQAAADIGEQVTVEYTHPPTGISRSVSGVVEYAKGDTYVVASDGDPPSRIIVHAGAAYSLIGLVHLGEYAMLEVDS